MSNDDKNSDDKRKNYQEEITDNCFFEGKEYSQGAVICMAGSLYRCGYGAWTPMNQPCPGKDINDED